MREFFLNQNTSIFNFEIFNFLHLISLVITLIGLIFIIYNKNKIANISNKRRKQIRIIFGIVLLLFYIFRRGSFVYYGVYNWKNHLSLGFCNMTSWLFIIYCLRGNKKIYNLCYYCAFCGPLLSILFPVIKIGINNYSFVNFIMIHHIVFLMNILFAIWEKKEYHRKDLLTSYMFIVVYVLLSYLFNFIFDTHYNELGQFIVDAFEQNHLMTYIIGHQMISTIILMIVGIGFCNIGGYVLRLINFRRLENYEKVN